MNQSACRPTNEAGTGGVSCTEVDIGAKLLGSRREFLSTSAPPRRSQGKSGIPSRAPALPTERDAPTTESATAAGSSAPPREAGCENAIETVARPRGVDHGNGWCRGPARPRIRRGGGSPHPQARASRSRPRHRVSPRASTLVLVGGDVRRRAPSMSLAHVCGGAGLRIAVTSCSFTRWRAARAVRWGTSRLPERDVGHQRFERADDVARFERRVRAGRDRDLVLAVDADRDERDTGGSSGYHDLTVSTSLARSASSAASPSSSSPTAPSIQTPVQGPLAEWPYVSRLAIGARRRDRLVPALAAVMLREHAAGDGLPRTRQRRARHHQVDVDRAEDRDDRAPSAFTRSPRARLDERRAVPTNRVMNAGASTSSATRALSSGSSPVGHGLRRIPRRSVTVPPRVHVPSVSTSTRVVCKSRATGRSRSPARAGRASTRRRSTPYRS